MKKNDLDELARKFHEVAGDAYKAAGGKACDGGPWNYGTARTAAWRAVAKFSMQVTEHELGNLKTEIARKGH